MPPPVDEIGRDGRTGARRFTYHPFEVALCGYSGTGKRRSRSTLLRLGRTVPVGFVKHDAHRFAMDTPGKDTYEAAAAGAVGV